MINWCMLKARDLLKSESLPLMEVAERVGFTSVAAFSRAVLKDINADDEK